MISRIVSYEKKYSFAILKTGHRQLCCGAFIQQKAYQFFEISEDGKYLFSFFVMAAQ